MQNDSKIAGKIKTQITRFSHKISSGFQKPTKEFMVQMLYGIQASKGVKLSNISRNLMENLALVRDGITGEPRSNGYWFLEVFGADVAGENLIALYGELYSQEARDFRIRLVM
jgi:hypothetical protein